MKKFMESQINQSIPEIFDDKTFYDKFVRVLSKYHSYYSLLSGNISIDKCNLNIVSLLMNTLIFLFFDAIFFSFINPDTGVCKTYKTITDCLSEKSKYLVEDHDCKWIPFSFGDEYHCSYVEPNHKVYLLIFVSVISGVISIPIKHITNEILYSCWFGLSSRNISGRVGVDQSVNSNNTPGSGQNGKYQDYMSVDWESDMFRLNSDLKSYMANLDVGEISKFNGKILIIYIFILYVLYVMEFSMYIHY
jgi:hypothetical protein